MRLPCAEGSRHSSPAKFQRHSISGSGFGRRPSWFLSQGMGHNIDRRPRWPSPSAIAKIILACCKDGPVFPRFLCGQSHPGGFLCLPQVLGLSRSIISAASNKNPRARRRSRLEQTTPSSTLVQDIAGGVLCRVSATKHLILPVRREWLFQLCDEVFNRVGMVVIFIFCAHSITKAIRRVC